MKINKQIIVLLSIFLLSFTSALYSGESQTYPNNLNSDNLLYTIIENTSYITYPIIDINLTHITITIPNNSNPNSYKIVFINNESEQTITIHSKRTSYKKVYVNNTIIKEVPVIEYIENKTIEYEVIEIKEEPEVIEINPFWMFLPIFLIIALFIYIVFKLTKKNSSEKLNTSERRL